MNLKHVIALMLGDLPCEDGGRDTFYVHTSHPAVELSAAFELGTGQVGYDLTEKVAAEENDNTITAAQLQRLLDLGLQVDLEHDELLWEGCFDDKPISFEEALTARALFSMGEEMYIKLYMFIARLGEPTLEYKLLDLEQVRIGGGGLLFS
jgi:hypothetical protein